MVTRREFLGTISLPLAASTLTYSAPAPKPGVLEILAGLAGHGGDAEEIAADESYWFEVQEAFTVDRSVINLNNGGVSPAPAVVQASMKRYLDFSNQLPPYHLWQILEPRKETVRVRLAKLFGCDAEEIALTRNTSESLQICQFGLDFDPGDEVLTTDQDYPRMLTTWEQRERRDGIVLRKISVPVPCEDPQEFVRRFEAGITPKTRLILMSHVINLTGQILPVKGVVEMARSRGIPVLVDGAHSFAHFPFTREDLGCDYFGTSLHKWLFAPHGTGMLYVRRERIRGLWPLMAATKSMDENIRKFEEIGTHPAAPYLAIADAITFHEGIGPERKAARMRYLRDRWAKRLLEHDRVRLHTSLAPGMACGIATFQVEGIGTSSLVDYLWKRHRILTTGISHPDFEGVRVSPSVYTTLRELEVFCEAVEKGIEEGLPG